MENFGIDINLPNNVWSSPNIQCFFNIVDYYCLWASIYARTWKHAYNLWLYKKPIIYQLNVVRSLQNLVRLLKGYQGCIKLNWITYMCACECNTHKYAWMCLYLVKGSLKKKEDFLKRRGDTWYMIHDTWYMNTKINTLIQDFDSNFSLQILVLGSQFTQKYSQKS